MLRRRKYVAPFPTNRSVGTVGLSTTRPPFRGDAHTRRARAGVCPRLSRRAAVEDFPAGSVR
eukprot:scaffold229020_cov31-Tisochrysis_lutea.AAC.1